MQLPKPPKLFSTRKAAETEATGAPMPEATEEAPRIWSPPPQPTMPEAGSIPETPAQETQGEDYSRYAPPPVFEPAPETIPEPVPERETVSETAPEVETVPEPEYATEPEYTKEPEMVSEESATDEFIPEPEEDKPVAESAEEEPVLTPMDENEVVEEYEEETSPEPEEEVDEEVTEPETEYEEETIPEPETVEEVIPEPETEIVEETVPESNVEETVIPEPENKPIKERIMEEEYNRKYARPQERPVESVEEIEEKYTPRAEPTLMTTTVPDLGEPLPPEENEKAIYKLLGVNQKIIRAKSVSSIPFSDIWYTAEKVAYIRDESTRFALVPFLSDDLSDFYKALEQGYTGQSSYAVRFAGESYRVERIMTLSGPQYNCRKMPGRVPDIYTLGLPKHIVDYLLTLSREAGLILFGGPTGMGKTTSASALMQRFLQENGGFMYTIEDPPEMPLDGLYRAENGGLGLCKQCPVDNERWGDGIKSALRSRPRYILVGEIRTPETASQVLRAATSGHLVLSTIHASTVEDSLESIIKYASGAGLTESLAADLLARGILAVVHQKLEGSTRLRPVITAAFANPHLTGGDQMRSLIRNNTINLQTLVEAQSSRLFQGRPLFEDK